MNEQEGLKDAVEIYKMFTASRPEQRAEFIAALREIGLEQRPSFLKMADAFQAINDRIERKEHIAEE